MGMGWNWDNSIPSPSSLHVERWQQNENGWLQKQPTLGEGRDSRLVWFVGVQTEAAVAGGHFMRCCSGVRGGQMYDRAGDVVFGVRWGPGVGQARHTSTAWMCPFFLHVNTWMNRACTSSSLCTENAFGCEQTALFASPW